MNKEQLQAIETELNSMRNNKVIREFVENEAYTKIADDIMRLKADSVCTNKAVRLLVNNVSNPDIKQRFLKYCGIGYMAVIATKYSVN